MADERLRAIIRASRDLPADPMPPEWTDEEAAAIRDNPEAERIVQGRSAFEHPDIDRLSALAKEVGPRD